MSIQQSLKKGGLGIGLAGLLAACGSPGEQPSESRGFIARVGGEVRLLSSREEASRICAETLCEPNYLYQASFGAAKPAGETPDYSRALMHVADAWKVTEGSPEVVVAVVDSGVQVDHPDLKDNIWSNLAEARGATGTDDDGNGYVDDVYGYDFVNKRANAIDDNEHGTHCAGIIAAAHNDFGTVGVAPRARVMPLKFLDSSGSGDTVDAIQAIDYAVKMGARIISNSWGGGGASTFLNDAIQRAVASGVFVVAAAGNEAKNIDATPSYPASYPGVIAVASTDATDSVSSFSNVGLKSVFVAAPGGSIFSTVLKGKYAKLSGTSMATPQVAGALALALSVQRSAPLANADIQSLLCASAASKVASGQSACGRMDVGEFIRRVAQAP